MNRQFLPALGVLLVLAIILQLWLLSSRQGLPEALGQTTGAPAGEVMLATGADSSGGNAVLYAYNARTQTLSAYTTHHQSGIELLGARRLTCDFELIEVPEAAARRESAVKKICALVEKEKDSKAAQAKSQEKRDKDPKPAQDKKDAESKPGPEKGQ